ncbi:MAG: hypothetical protein ACRDKI_03020 [Solirubrobacterales bacterium]
MFRAAAALALLSLALAAPAGAAKYERYIRVTPLLNAVDTCRTGADQVSWAYTLKAKLKRRNVARPRSIRMRYEITDLDTGAVLRLQVLKLKPKKYYKVGLPTQYTAGHHLQFQLDVAFKSPIDGKRLRKRSISNLSVPTVAEMDQANAAKPQSPRYPSC